MAQDSRDLLAQRQRYITNLSMSSGLKANTLSDAFVNEALLVQSLLTTMRDAKRKGWTVFLEVEAGVGCADIVLSNRNPNSTKALKALASISPRLAPLLNPEIADRITNLAKLAEVVGTSPSTASRTYAALKNSKLIHGYPDKFYITDISAPPFKNILALEAKLSDWKRALIQAYRNKQFADESWVVVDHRYHRPALKNIEDFKRSGVGLASASSEGGIIVHLAAEANFVLSPIKRWTAQAELARRTIGTAANN